MNQYSQRGTRSLPAALLLLLLAFLVAGGSPAAAQKPVADQHGRVGVPADKAGRSPRLFGSEPPPPGERTLAAPVLEPLPLSAPAAAVDASGFSEKWRWAVFGYGVGRAGLQIADIDGDGSNDVLSTGSGYSASGSYAYVLHAQGGDYVQRWVVPGNDYAFARLAQLDGDPQREIVVGTAAEIRVYDGLTHALTSTITTAAGPLTGLEAADVDADGDIEIVVIDESDLYVYDLATGDLQAKKLGFGGRSLALGQIDADTPLEIGVAGLSGSGLVLDGLFLNTQWGRSSGFGQTIAFGDLDGDGLDEVATSASGYPYAFTGVRAFDPGTNSLLFEVVGTYNVGALAIGDVMSNRRAEVLLSRESRISVFDGLTGAEIGSIRTNYSASAIAVGDADNDGRTEIAWGGDGTPIGSNTLQIADAATQLREWESLDLNGPFYALDAKDLNGDGKVEVIAGSFESNNGYSDGRYLFFDGATGAPQFVSEPTTGNNWTGLWQIRTANLDGDPQSEVCVTTGEFYTGRILCYDSLTHAEEWHVDVPDGLVVSSLEIADVDGNGSLEVVAGTTKVHTGAPGTFAYAFTGRDGLLVWRSPDLASGYWPSWVYLRVTELDGDPNREVLLGDWENGFAVVRGESGALDFVSSPDPHISAVATPDRDRNGVAEILVGTTFGSVQRLDPTNAAVLETVFSGYTEPIRGLAVADLDGDGADDYAFGLGSQLVVRSGKGLATLFTSDLFGQNTGALDAVKVVELDGDIGPEILINTGFGVAVFDAPGALLFTDDFETGDLSRWSAVQSAATLQGN